MKLLFNLEYQTVFGELLMLNIKNEDGNEQHHAMTTLNGRDWFVELTMDANGAAPSALHYFYSVQRGENTTRTEWLVAAHKQELGTTDMVLNDRWIDTPDDAYRYTSAFTDCVAQHAATQTVQVVNGQLLLKVRAPQLRTGERLAIVGSTPYLGEWNCAKALPMTEHQTNEWVATLLTDRLPQKSEFKFVVLSDGTHTALPIWENGENRQLLLPTNDKRNAVVVNELQQAWFSIPEWRGAGVVIPVFALRSEGSFGVGDFGDLKLMVDWCAKTGMRILQILPINDTTITHTWQDSYPYNSISIYALHPQYTDLRQLPALKDEVKRAAFEALRQELNALPQIDYERVNEAKMNYLKEIFAQEWTAMKRRASFKLFFEQNSEWLEPYARFCVYRDKYGTAKFSEWPQKLPKPDKKALDFWYFIQYNLDQQMRLTHQHARQNKVILKGDIPIGISRDGVEAWVEPRYFNLNGQAGAPPDAFAEDGQNWGFPTYNWDEMLSDGCQWWVRRFRKMAEYFDAYRIDHVLGFFRIWEIPVPHKSGLYGQFQPSLPLSRDEIGGYGLPFREEFYLEDHKRKDMWHPRINATKLESFKLLPSYEQDNFWRLYNDYFYRRNNQFWYHEAMKKLPLLTQATRMLCCAEDLGMVPDCVPWVMNDLRILSLEIQSMPKDPSVRFGRLDRNPYRSVDTISTHDMSTLRQWWDEDQEQTQDYYNNELHYGGPAPHPLSGRLAAEIVGRHLASPSMLCLLSLQDWLSIDEQLRLPDANAERINIPANPRHYWRYRMHLTLEQLLSSEDFNHEVTILIQQSGRL